MACLVPVVIEAEVELGSLCEAHPCELRPQFTFLQFEIRALLFILYHVVGGPLAPLLLLLLLLPLL